MALVLSASSASAAPPKKPATKTAKKRTTTTSTSKTAKGTKAKKTPPPEESDVPEAFPDKGDEATEPSDTPAVTPAPKTEATAPKAGTTAPAPKLTPQAKPTLTATPRATETSPAAPAWAGSVAVLAVAREPGSAEMASQLQDELGRLLSTHKDVQLVQLGEAFPPPAPDSLAEGDKLFDDGKSAYDNLDPEAAAAKFQLAADFYVHHPAEMRPEQLANTYIYLGASQQLNGDKDAARVAFLRALAVAPSVQPDNGLFGGDVQSAFLAAQEESRKKGPGTLSVESQPSGAKVTVRGKELGDTPLKDVELPAGRHAVVVSRPGYAPYAVLQEVSSTQPAVVKAELEPAPGLSAILDAASQAASAKAFESDIMPAEAGAIADRLGARYVVFAAVSRDRKGRARAELQAWDTRTQSRLRGVTILPGSKDETAMGASERVHAFVTGAVKPATSMALPAFMKKPWFWAAVGGAAVVTAGVVYYASSGQPGYSPITGSTGLHF